MLEAQHRVGVWLLVSDTSASLDLNNLGLAVLPPLPPDLVRLNCSHNKLRALPPLPPRLEIFICSFNKLTTLGPAPLPPGLAVLFCTYNRLTTLGLHALPPDLLRFNLCLQRAACTAAAATAPGVAVLRVQPAEGPAPAACAPENTKLLLFGGFV